jgi:uncharacterized protein with NRDE domain
VCLALLALDALPGWPLVLAANRDERRDRPARPLDWWQDRPDVVGGRDAQAGGTWLAARRDGRIATVLNDARITPPPGAPSRGQLVAEALDASDAATAAAAIHARREVYAGFHLLVGEPGSGWYCGTHAEQPRLLSAGIHAVGNAGLDPGDPRLVRAVHLFRSVLTGGVDRPVLLDVLADRQEVGAGTGDCRPVFIDAESFGTRCSTVFAISTGGDACIHERRFEAGGRMSGETIRHWQVPLDPGTA